MTVGGELVDRVVSAARRERFRRVALLSAVGLTLATAVATPAVLVGVRGPRAVVAQSALDDRAAGLDSSGRRPADAATGRIYAAVIRHIAPAAATVVVRTATCDTVDEAPAGDGCRDAVIGAAVRQQVTALLGGRVRFADHPAPAVGPRSPVVTFGRLVAHGTRAELGMQLVCGALCGHGGTLVLVRTSGGGWQVTGTTGHGWIS